METTVCFGYLLDTQAAQRARLDTISVGGASLYVVQGKVKRAGRLFAWADAMRENLGDHRPPVEQNSVENDLAVIRSKVDENDFANFSAEGRTMTVEQAMDLALQG